ncbi:hypothetical protein BGX38DRAFT_1162123 [Terfezia claveryi]|nr:hypothetical protein BGX38DRAFT_1162123 [Terfezia claveryi]
MGGALSIEPAIELASREIEEKLKLVNAVVDRQRGKVLSSTIAFMYFTLLMTYTLYSLPSLGIWAGTGEENFFIVVQFVILGVWIADLVSLTGVGNSRDGFYILALMMTFAGFVFYRGRNDKGRKLEKNPRQRKEVVGQ